MSTALKAFSFEHYQIRVVQKDGQPWWVAKDVCDVLELSDVSMSVAKLDDDEKLIQKILVSGQNRDVITINESGLYALIVRSNKPQAKKFRKWVTSEVLPSIRKTGEYATPEAQKRKANNKDELALRRLEVMEKNANYRMAKLILEGMNQFSDVMTTESKTVFMAKYGELITDQSLTHLLPVAAEQWYSAGDLGKEFGVSATMIGRISNNAGIKAPDGESNEYGTWVRSKSQHSSREVMAWVYNENARGWFAEHFNVAKIA